MGGYLKERLRKKREFNAKNVLCDGILLGGDLWEEDP